MSRGVGNTWKFKRMARKLIVHISVGKGRVRESLEAELATSKDGLVLRRPGIDHFCIENNHFRSNMHDG